MQAGIELGIVGRPQTIPLKQAAAAIGQSRLMRAYKDALRKHGMTAAQVLLTRDDLANRRRYLNARNALYALLAWKVVPIINENDTVATEEIRYGDNDRLAARVAQLVMADALILLSDVDGFYTADPVTDPGADLASLVFSFNGEIVQTIRPEGRTYANDNLLLDLSGSRPPVSGRYTLALQATNVNGQSRSRSIPLSVDLEPPTITAVSPADGATLFADGPTMPLEFEVSATDDVGIASVSVIGDRAQGLGTDR